MPTRSFARVAARFFDWRRAVLGGDVGDQGQEQGAEGDQGNAGGDEPAGAAEVAEDADAEADQHQSDIRAGAVGEQRGEREDEIRHGGVIIIASMPDRSNGSVAEVKEALAEVGYLADEPAALVSFLAQKLGKPVLVEGPAGVGKTELAKALSRATGRELVRLQCYEGLDEAKAMYEWNYRKQLLRIQAGGSQGDWEDVQDDIFSPDFLLERPLMQAIASPEPVVLLIDEIDKTDQEFEAMLLELLSDFQITIPELGRIEATTMPIVVLTSNDSRELTEALKRRCLYLWLDYPELEREMEIVRLHAPDLPETLARRMVEVIRMVRDLDLKKPPSIAESIDWARTLLLMGAEDIDQETFAQSMSIIVKHRTDIDLVAERVGVKLADPLRAEG
jgi:MoxR-like ATPase